MAYKWGYHLLTGMILQVKSIAKTYGAMFQNRYISIYINIWIPSWELTCSLQFSTFEDYCLFFRWDILVRCMAYSYTSLICAWWRTSCPPKKTSASEQIKSYGGLRECEPLQFWPNFYRKKNTLSVFSFVALGKNASLLVGGWATHLKNKLVKWGRIIWSHHHHLQRWASTILVHGVIFPLLMVKNKFGQLRLSHPTYRSYVTTCITIGSLPTDLRPWCF